MANSKTTGLRYRQATINAAPGAAGYFTVPVNPRGRKVDRLYMSIAETGDSASFDATVTLQFKPDGVDDWQDYDTYTEETREIIEDAGNCDWRVGVIQGDYTDGEVTVQIDW